jgi:hypothetical protein
VRAGVHEPVPVRRSTAEKPTLDRGLGDHGSANPDLDAVPLPLGHSPVQGHHQIVGVAARVHLSADLRNPQLHAVVHEDGEGQAELIAVKGTRRLADDHGGEAALGVLERFQQRSCLGPSLPR